MSGSKQAARVSVDTGSNPRPDQRRHMVATNSVLAPRLLNFCPSNLVLSPLFASFPQIPPSPLSPIPISLLSHLGSFFLFQTYPSPSLFSPHKVSHIPIALSPHVRKTWVCVVSALIWERSSSGSTGPVVGSSR